MDLDPIATATVLPLAIEKPFLFAHASSLFWSLKWLQHAATRTGLPFGACIRDKNATAGIAQLDLASAEALDGARASVWLCDGAVCIKLFAHGAAGARSQSKKHSKSECGNHGTAWRTDGMCKRQYARYDRIHLIISQHAASERLYIPSPHPVYPLVHTLCSYTCLFPTGRASETCRALCCCAQN